MILKFRKSAMLTLLITFAFSCSNDGKDGIPGATGTANVIYSDWIPVPSTHTSTSFDGRTGFIYSFDAPQITQQVLDQGIVMSYVKGVSPEVFSLPYTSPIDFGVSQILSIGTVQMFSYKLDNSGGLVIPNTSSLRYVIIPGGIAAKGKTQPDYKNMSYEQVCSIFNIPL